jgi:hypothetical protein
MKKFEFELSDEMVKVLCKKFGVDENQVIECFDDLFVDMNDKQNIVSVVSDLDLFNY